MFDVAAEAATHKHSRVARQAIQTGGSPRDEYCAEARRYIAFRVPRACESTLLNFFWLRGCFSEARHMYQLATVR